MTHRIAYAFRFNKVEPGTVLAVTHTRKAAAELKERVARLGYQGAADARTFHGAGLRIVSNFWA